MTPEDYDLDNHGVFHDAPMELREMIRLGPESFRRQCAKLPTDKLREFTAYIDMRSVNLHILEGELEDRQTREMHALHSQILALTKKIKDLTVWLVVLTGALVVLTFVLAALTLALLKTG